MKQEIFKFLPIILIIAIGTFLRFWGIVHHNFPFTYDVGRDLLAVRDLIYYHKFSLIGATSGQQGIFYGPWWYWILTIPFALSKGDPTLITLFIALTGVLSIIVIYWWGVKYLNKTSGLFLAGLFALVPVFVSTTTQIWSPNLLILLTTLELILLSSLRRLSFWELFVFGFISLLLTEMELMFGAIFLIGLTVNLLVWHQKLLLSKKVFPILAGAFLIELPRLLFEVKHQFIQIKSLPLLLTSHQSINIDRLLRLKIFWEQITSVLPSRPIILQVITVLIICVLFLKYLQNEKNKERAIFAKELVIFTAIFFAGTVFWNREFWSYYLTGLPVVFALILSIGLYYFQEYYHQHKHRIITLLIMVLYLIFVSEPFKILASVQKPIFIGDAAVYRNQEETLDYIYSQARGYQFNYIAYTPPLIDYTWQYMFWWYGRHKYGYESVKNRQERFYVIIEPDSGFQERITTWLKIRENDGKIIKEEMLPNGIMVQTRTRPKE